MVARRRQTPAEKSMHDHLLAALRGIQAPNYNPHPFNDPAPVDTRAMAHALASALKRPEESSRPFFNPSVKLDTSQVRDLRQSHPDRMTKMNRADPNYDSHPWDARVGRPAPRKQTGHHPGAAGSAPKQTIRKPKPITNQGRHDG